MQGGVDREVREGEHARVGLVCNQFYLFSGQ